MRMEYGKIKDLPNVGKVFFINNHVRFFYYRCNICTIFLEGNSVIC